MNDFQFPHRVMVVRPGEHLHLREQFQRLRYQEFALRCGFEPENEAGREHDAYDQYSTYLVIVNDGVIQAGCRLIDGEQVPITLDPSLVAEGRHFEISRMVRNSQATVDGHAVMCSLYAGVVRHAFGVCGYQQLYCDTRRDFFRSLRALLGDAIVPIGAPKVHDKNGVPLELVPTRISACDQDVILERLARRVAPQLAAA